MVLIDKYFLNNKWCPICDKYWYSCTHNMSDVLGHIKWWEFKEKMREAIERGKEHDNESRESSF
jgi:hypothetical protein